MLTERLKALNTEVVELDDLLEFDIFAKALRAAYEQRNLPVPAWLDDKARMIARDIDARIADQKTKRARDIRAHLSTLETNTEKRARLQAELDALEGQPVGAKA